MTLSLLLVNAGAVLAMASVLWVVSVKLKDASVVDPWWPIFFLLITSLTVAQTPLTPGKALLLGMVALWALRLWLHLFSRSLGKAEDPRYAAFRQKYGPERYWWFSFFQVFLLQAVLALIISAPLQLAAAADGADPISPTDMLGAVLFLAGFLFEAVSDWQLQAFRNNPASKGRVLNTGLWKYTRHPNYFGEALLWWGFGMCAVDLPLGWLALLSPLFLTFLLLRVSGVSMLDAHLARTRPGYEDYMRSTSSFLPRPPAGASH